MRKEAPVTITAAQASRGRRKRIAVVMGTRPEAIKMAPVVHALRRQGGPVRNRRRRHGTAPPHARSGALDLPHRAGYRSGSDATGPVAVGSAARVLTTMDA